MTQRGADHPATGIPVGASDFRAAMRLIVGNVSIITAGIGTERSGLVVTSLSSLSAEPPMLIACVNRSSSTLPLIERYRHFGASSLGPHHHDIAVRFSGVGGLKGNDRYKGADWVTLNTGASLLANAVCAFDCRLSELLERGTHSIVIGVVEAVRIHDGGEALVYWRKDYRALAC